MPTAASERRALLLALLLVLAGLKLAFNPGLGRNSLDGDYYFQIARHVAAGDGLATSLSLYHQGLRAMPQPTNASPLWPLVLGAAGAAGNLWAAALLLPELLYLLDLVLLYLLANALCDGALPGVGAGALAGPGGAVTLGHAAVLLFGLNPVFFEFTSLPYTEGLAFCLLLLALLATRKAAGAGSVRWAALAGALAGGAFLTRAQMGAALVAVPAALACAAGRQRRFLRLAVAATGAGAAVIAPWAIWLATWARPFHPRLMWSLAAYRETAELAPFRFGVPVGSAGEWLLDRLGGLAVAFDPTDGDSYLASFGLAAWLVPLGLAALAARPGELRGVLARLACPPGTAALASLLAGALAVVPVHTAHARYFKEWLFGFRHGLPLVLPLVLALGWLAAGGRRWPRRLALALAAGSLATGARGVGGLLARDDPAGLWGPERALVEWLGTASPPPVVVTTQAHTLAVYSRARLHWMECGEPAAQTLALLDRAGAHYVLAYPGESRCAFLRGLTGEAAPLAAVSEFGAGAESIRVYARAAP